jgi:5-methylcytosine-specific restriction endonuclease McrA
MKKKQQGLERLTTYSFDHVKPIIGTGIKLQYGEVVVRTGYKRLIVFKRNNKCVQCGLVGTFIAIERQTKNFTGSWFITLYGIDVEGDEVALTVDHKYPKSKGGSSEFKNLQTMCQPCNLIKDDK